MINSSHIPNAWSAAFGLAVATLLARVRVHWDPTKVAIRRRSGRPSSGKSACKVAAVTGQWTWPCVTISHVRQLYIRISLYKGAAELIRLGLTPFEASIVVLTAPLAGHFALALGFYKRDGYPLTWCKQVMIRQAVLPL